MFCGEIPRQGRPEHLLWASLLNSVDGGTELLIIFIAKLEHLLMILLVGVLERRVGLLPGLQIAIECGL